MTGPENARRTHKLLGSDPTPKQERIYEAYPRARGASAREMDQETFESALVMAITQTFPNGPNAEPFKCYFFVPASAEKWAIEQLNVSARRIFEKLKGMPPARRSLAAKQIGRFLKCIMMGSRVLQLEKGPERWVAFGFEKSDPIPDWLRDGLLDEPT
jgi:hypothetical protein